MPINVADSKWIYCFYVVGILFLGGLIASLATGIWFIALAVTFYFCLWMCICRAIRNNSQGAETRNAEYPVQTRTQPDAPHAGYPVQTTATAHLRATEDINEPAEQDYSPDKVLLRRRLEFAGPLSPAFNKGTNKYNEDESSGLHLDDHRQQFGRIGLKASSLSTGSTGRVTTDEREQRIFIFSEPLPLVGNLMCDIESPFVIEDQKSDSAEHQHAEHSGNALACEESKTEVEPPAIRPVQIATHDDSWQVQEISLLLSDEIDTTCGICLMEYQVNDVVAWSFIERCKHAYHEDCISSWLYSSLEISSRRGPTCPVCRHEFVIGG